MTVVSTTPINNQSLLSAYVAKLPQRSPDDTSEIILGSGDYRYRVVYDWAKLPEGRTFLECPGIAIDAKDNVYVFERGEHPVNVFDRDGNFLRSWGEGVFANPHGVFVGADGMIYLADDGDHTVRKCTPEGKVLMTIGTPGKPSAYMSGEPFCRPTDVALSPKGEIYVSDGYYNARVHKFSADGKHLLSWGSPGTTPGSFNIVHSLMCDEAGLVYVADRENHRIQIFDGDGNFIKEWVTIYGANSIDQDKNAKDVFYVGKAAPKETYAQSTPNCGPAIFVMNAKGERLATIGAMPAGFTPDRFLSSHGLAVDSHGDLYLTENALSMWKNVRGNEAPPRLFPIRKLVRV